MKLTSFLWQAMFPKRPTLLHNPPDHEQKDAAPLADYDQYAEMYYIQLINALILFSYTSVELQQLAAPAFDPLFELESEIDIAFIPACFETIFRMGLINPSFKTEILKFKQDTDDIPAGIWDYTYIDQHEVWQDIRLKAQTLLQSLGVKNCKYNDKNVTVYYV